MPYIIYFFQVAPLLPRQVILFQKKRFIHLIYNFTIYKLYIFFILDRSLIFLAFFVFIFYIALIMNIRIFLLIRDCRENHLIKYLHNRNNHSFHHSIATCVLITYCFLLSL